MKIEKQHQVGIRYTTSAPLLAGLLLTFALVGCSNKNATRIETKDYKAAFPQMRMAINFDHVRETASPHTGHAIELGVTTGSGSDSQSLASGQAPIIVDGLTFTAPQQLRNDFAYTYSEILWRYRFFNKIDSSGFELTAGLGENLLDLKVSSDTQVATRQFKDQGFRIGAGLLYSLSHSSSLQARGILFRSLSMEMSRAELVYAKTFLNNFRLRAGFAGGSLLKYDTGSSDYSLIFFGPLLALDLEF